MDAFHPETTASDASQFTNRTAIFQVPGAYSKISPHVLNMIRLPNRGGEGSKPSRKRNGVFSIRAVIFISAVQIVSELSAHRLSSCPERVLQNESLSRSLRLRRLLAVVVTTQSSNGCPAIGPLQKMFPSFIIMWRANPLPLVRY
jgi:hypothetical protein